MSWVWCRGTGYHGSIRVAARAGLAALLLGTGCVAAPAMAPADALLPPLEGTAWLAQDIDGAGVLDRAPATIAFEPSRKVAGRAACNRYFGSFEQAGEALQIRPTGLTRMACPPEVMDEERKFLVALEAVKWGRREGDTLVLLDGDARVRMRLTVIPRQSARQLSTEDWR